MHCLGHSIGLECSCPQTRVSIQYQKLPSFQWRQSHSKGLWEQSANSTPATRVCCQNRVASVSCLIIAILFLLHFRFIVVTVQKCIVTLTATIFATSSIGFALTNPMTSAQTGEAEIAFFHGFMAFS